MEVVICLFLHHYLIKKYFFKEKYESVKSPRSNEPIKSGFGLNLMFGRINGKILYHKVRPTLAKGINNIIFDPACLPRIQPRGVESGMD